MPDPGDSGQPLRVGACLSLTGRFARFGSQAAAALDTWTLLDGGSELLLDDDESAPRTLERGLPRLARTCDILLGPYSTQLMRTAGKIAAGENLLLWNHGGSGDDVAAAQPGHVLSVLTPASGYAGPFLRHLKENYPPARLAITHGKGAFGRQVADGAARTAERLGVDFLRVP